MITAILIFVSVYLGVRFALSEVSQKLRQIYDELERRIWGTSPPLTSHALVTPKRHSNGLQSNNKPTVQTPAAQNRSSGPVLRKTGAQNALPPYYRYKNQGPSRNLLQLPFMDSGNWMKSKETNGTFINYQMKNSPIRSLTTNEFQQFSSLFGKHSVFSGSSASANIRNMFQVPVENRNSTIFTRFFHHVSFILQKNPPFNYPDVSNKVLSSDRVKLAIKNAVLEDLKGRIPDDEHIIITHFTHKQRAVEALCRMKSCISSLLLKIAAWVMYKLLGRMLNGIEVHKEQIETLKRASQNQIPIIYLPLHRSHLDYILVTLILYMNDLRAPLVAAGNNLMIPFFGSLLRGLGAFFIKRKLDPQKGKKDFVYRAILHTYMEESLREGHSLEFFIEGGRSRTGKAILPKAGLLSIVVDTLMSGGINDAYIVPIAMSYEKILDGNFVSEQMGKAKVMESFTSAIRGIWRTLHSNFGTVRIDFCQPFSLKEFLLAAEYSYNLPLNNLQPCALRQNHLIVNHQIKARRISEYGSEVVLEDHRQVIKDLADYVVYDAFNANALMSTNVIGFLFLTKHRKGTTFYHLVNSLNWLREEIAKRNKTIGFSGESADVIKQACTLFGKQLVNTEIVQMEWSSGNTDNNNVKITFYRPAVNLPEVLELQYYANAVLPVFLLESIIVNAFYSVIGDDGENQQNKCGVQRGHLIKQALELCSILQYEFIFSPPGTSLCSVLNATIDDIVENGQIVSVESKESDNEVWNSIPVIITDVLDENHLITENESELISQKLQINSSNDHSSMLQFLRCILSPFIESYWLVSSTLPKLVNLEVEEATFIQEVKRLGQKKFHLGQLSYEECLGLDSLKNAVKLLESWKILKNRPQNGRNVYSLYSNYDSETSVKDVIARIEKYKK